MPDPITLGCIISATSLFVSTLIGILNIQSTRNIQQTNHSIKQEFNVAQKKEKFKLKSKYTFTTNPNDYIKIACLLHLTKCNIIKCSFLNITLSNNVTIILTLSIQNIKVFFSEGAVKCLFNDLDNSIWVTFQNTHFRSQFERYLNSLDTNSLISKCAFRPPDINDIRAYRTLGLLPPDKIPIFPSPSLPPN